ncbi:MAG: DUF6446 family protein [Pseudomonadota bacterium]
MNGKVVGTFLVVTALVVGGAIYWLQVFAYYEPVRFVPGDEIRLTPIENAVPEAIAVENIEGIDGTSSPLRFRACFTTRLSQEMLTETYRAYPDPVPTIAPYWFDCFDAKAIGAALEKGEARAFLSQKDIAPQIDRVVAVFPDGRAYAWHQVQPEAPEGIEN